MDVFWFWDLCFGKCLSFTVFSDVWESFEADFVDRVLLKGGMLDTDSDLFPAKLFEPEKWHCSVCMAASRADLVVVAEGKEVPTFGVRDSTTLRVSRKGFFCNVLIDWSYFSSSYFRQDQENASWLPLQLAVWWSRAIFITVTLFSAAGAIHCLWATRRLRVTKPIAHKASQRIWNEWLHRTTQVCCFDPIWQRGCVSNVKIKCFAYSHFSFLRVVNSPYSADILVTQILENFSLCGIQQVWFRDNTSWWV